MADQQDKGKMLRGIIRKLLLERSNNKRQFLDTNELNFLLDHALDALKMDGTLVEVEPPVVICGDTHGQFYDLIRVFDHGGWPPNSRYLFLGDYVDRGSQGIEVISLLLAFKVAYPRDFFMLRGNHECASINRVYGFWEECKRRYSETIYWKFNQIFPWLPLAGLVGDRIFCMHGGLSPELETLDQIREMPRPVTQVNEGLACDLMWSDPAPNIEGFLTNTRGCSYRFGEDIVVNFCANTGIDLIVRAHQVVMPGYEFFAKGRVVTLFSAPNYCNQFDNSAAMMTVKPDLSCKIKQLHP